MNEHEDKIFEIARATSAKINKAHREAAVILKRDDVLGLARFMFPSGASSLEILSISLDSYDHTVDEYAQLASRYVNGCCQLFSKVVFAVTKRR